MVNLIRISFSNADSRSIIVAGAVCNNVAVGIIRNFDTIGVVDNIASSYDIITGVAHMDSKVSVVCNIAI